MDSKTITVTTNAGDHIHFSNQGVSAAASLYRESGERIEVNGQDITEVVQARIVSEKN